MGEETTRSMGDDKETPGRRVRVLIVDDHDQVRRMTRQMLELEGFEVVEAGRTREALTLFDAHEIDVVVTDIYMPGEDGIALIQDLRRRRANVPVVAITGGGEHHDTSPLRVAAALGAGALLQKPFRFTELAGAIRRLVEAAG
jgi:two-component system, NtrC family, C4-dicarboxylate transport response regulator DctD